MFFFSFEAEIATSTSSGVLKAKIGKPRDETTSGWIKIMWAPLLMRVEVFNENSAVGLSIMQFQIKCLDLVGSLMDASPSLKLAIQ